MAVPAMALECPDDSLDLFYDNGNEFGFSYYCDDGFQTHVIVTAKGTSLPKLVEALLNETDRVKLVETIGNIKCLRFKNKWVCQDAETTPIQ